MQIEVCCPGCGSGYLVDAASAGADFHCPSCSRPVPVPAAAAAAATAPTATATTAAAAVAVAPPAPAPPSPAETSEEIVCPRCQLHFSPRRHRVTTETTDRPRVLIVEDAGYFRKTAEEALASHYEVRTATNVNEAELALAGGDIDVMVLDINLGGGDQGRRLLKGRTRNSCPILLLTTQDESEIDGEEWEELRRLGVDDIVMTGMRAAESLARKVGTLLGRPPDDEEDID